MLRPMARRSVGLAVSVSALMGPPGGTGSRQSHLGAAYVRAVKPSRTCVERRLRDSLRGAHDRDVVPVLVRL